jgi:hypothetical protein
MADAPEQVIMERGFETVDANGNAGTIQLRIGQPYLKAGTIFRSIWCCPVQIIGVGIDHTYNAPGLDSLETVLNSLQLAKHMLEHHSQKNMLKITWQGEEDLLLWTYVEPTQSERSEEDKAETEALFQKGFDEFFEQFEGKRKGKTS